MSAERSRSLQKTLLASSFAASAGPEDPQPFRLEGVDDPGSQGGLGADDRQPDLVLPGEADQGRKIVGRAPGHILAVRSSQCRRCPGRRNALGPWALRNLPGQGVFPAAIADNEDIHNARCYPTSVPCRPLLRRSLRRRSRRCTQRAQGTQHDSDPGVGLPLRFGTGLGVSQTGNTQTDGGESQRMPRQGIKEKTPK